MLGGCQREQANEGLRNLFSRKALGRGVSLSGPEPLGPQHRLEGFDCGKPSLNDWLVRHARQAQGSGSARTFVVSEDDRVAGYFSLTAGQIDTLDALERIRNGMGQYRSLW